MKRVYFYVDEVVPFIDELKSALTLDKVKSFCCSFLLERSACCITKSTTQCLMAYLWHASLHFSGVFLNGVFLNLLLQSI